MDVCHITRREDAGPAGVVLAVHDDLLPGVQLDEAVPAPVPLAGDQPSPEWNLAALHAPELWALGCRGQGVVVAGQDTGYLWSHPALKAKYRGWDGTTADHNHNWHDAIHSGGGSAKVQLSKSRLTFGDVAIGQSAELSCVVKNSGSGEDETGGVSATQRFADMFRDARKYKSRLHVITQAPHLLADDIVSSCSNILIGFIKDSKDKDIVLSALARSEKGFRDQV